MSQTEAHPSVVSVLSNRHFLLLWTAQALSQTAQNAIWFGLMVVVEETTKSTTQMSIAVLSSILPSVLLGIVAGVFVDRTNKKQVLIVTNLLRAVAVLAFLFYNSALALVFVVNFLFCSISQFFGPAEASTIPQLVPRRQLITANSLFNLTFTASQLAGMVILAPPLIKFFGAPALFILTSAMFVVCSVLVSLLPSGEQPTNPLSTLRRETLFSQIWCEVKEGWSFVTTDRGTSVAMANLTLMSCLMLLMAMLAPRYVVGVLQIRAEDSVYVLAPAGLGVLVGTSLLGRLSLRFEKQRLVQFGLLAMGAGLFAMAWLDEIAYRVPDVLARAIGLLHLPIGVGLIPAVMLLMVFFGIEYAFVTVPAQTILMERAPVDSRGRIFAVQLMLGNVATIVPLLFIGGMADLFGIRQVIALVGISTAVLGWLTMRYGRVRMNPSHQSTGSP